MSKPRLYNWSDPVHHFLFFHLLLILVFFFSAPQIRDQVLDSESFFSHVPFQNNEFVYGVDEQSAGF